MKEKLKEKKYKYNKQIRNNIKKGKNDTYKS